MQWSRLHLGSLEGATVLASGAGTVTAKATLRVTAGPDQNFPTMAQPRKAVAAVVADGTVLAADAVPGTSAIVASSEIALKFGGADGAGGSIDLANRAKLASFATKVELASLTREENPAALEAKGVESFVAGTGSAANIIVTVTGPIREGDTVYFDQDMDTKMGAKESLGITGGVASKSFRLSNATSGAKVYYIPDGATEMKAGNFSAKFAVEYDAVSVKTPAAVTKVAKLVYNGVSERARAYAIPNAGSNDIANIRIKCEAGGTQMCTVFLECNEQNGMSHFGELGSTIAAGATLVLRAEDIADVLPDTDSWVGRLSCDVLSSKDVSVQVLVRSGDSLINNTYVD